MAGIDFQRLLLGNTISGVELHINKEGKESYRFIKLSKKKEEVEVLDKGGVYSSLAELKPFLDSKTPITLSVTGKDVVFKMLDKEVLCCPFWM